MTRPDGARGRSGGPARKAESTGGPARPRRPAPGEPGARPRRRPPPPESTGRAESTSIPPRPRPDGRRRQPPGDGSAARRSSGEIHTRGRDSDTPPPRRRRPPSDAERKAPTGANQTERRQRPGPRAPGPDGRPRKPRPRPEGAPGGNPGRARREDRPPGPHRPRRPEHTPATPTARSADGAIAGVTQAFRERVGRRTLTSRTGIGRGIIALLSVAVLVCTGYAWNSVTDLKSTITQLAGLDLGGADDGAVDILLVGTDSRTDAKGNPLSAKELRWLRSGEEVATNTDTILLVRIPNDGSSATAISIPRDSYVQVPGIGMSKINAAYGTTKEGVRKREVEAGTDAAKAEKDGVQAGRKALVDTVANLTGVKVDHYAEVGLLGFVLLTNAVGGVDVCLKAPVNEPFSGAKFKAGRQTLNGPKALSFVRQRHGLPRGDLDRITRQQVFMASLAQKMLSAKMLTDPGRLSDLQEAVSRSIVIDDNWDILNFAEQLKDLTGGRVKFSTIPVVTEQGWSEDGQQSVVEVDPKQVHAYTDALLTEKKNADEVEPADYTVDITNAGTIDGLAGNVSNIVTNKGFQPGKTSSDATDDRDSVVYAHSDDAGARKLAKDLGGLPVRVDGSLPDKHMRAVLTNTYEGPGSIADTGKQPDATPPSERTGSNRAPVNAGSSGPTCVN